MASLVMSLIILLMATALEEKMASGRPIHTITSEDGDIIDCINIYEQPAFKNPLLKDHKIQMEPTNYKRKENSGRLEQTWHKSGSCPKGTIPKLRLSNQNMDGLTQPIFFRPVRNSLTPNDTGRQEDVSAYEMSRSPYFGTEAGLYTKAPPEVAEPNEFSIAYAAVGSSSPNASSSNKTEYRDIKNVVAAGWMAYPLFFNDSQRRSFIFYSYNSSGCFNLQCGFVQTSFQFALGGVVKSPSPDSEAIHVNLQKDDVEQRWWVSFNDELIGYWPLTLFDGFFVGDVAQWGGLIYNTFPNEIHTTTSMGSGSFPTSKKDSDMIGNIKVATNDGMHAVQKPDNTNIPFPHCYGYSSNGTPPRPGEGFNIYFGGPGGPQCDSS